MQCFPNFEPMNSLFLLQLRLYNFRNHPQLSLTFSSKINGIAGPNGTGKTALLEAIHFLSMGKSPFTSNDKNCLLLGENAFMLDGQYQRIEQSEHIQCGWQEGSKKTLKRNSKTYERLADHIGLLPCVTIAPKDHELIEGPAELRRKLVDSVLSQANSRYLNALLTYTRVLQQRNAFLKQQQQAHTPDFDTMLEHYDFQLFQNGQVIIEYRSQLAQQLQRPLNTYYHQLSQGRESASILYQASLKAEDFLQSLQQNKNHDLRLGFTGKGPHKDDFVFQLQDQALKTFASQGQQKSYLIALKLAQFEFIAQNIGIKPIMLLDDIFDKLDENRVEQLVTLVNSTSFGQIFLTDTDPERTERIIKHINQNASLIRFPLNTP